MQPILLLVRNIIYALPLVFSYAFHAHADNPTPPLLRNPLKVNSIQEVLVFVLDAIVTLLIPVVVFMIIYAGFQFVTAQGNPEKLRKAKVALLWVLVGAAIIIGADELAAVISNTVSEIST